MYFQHISKLLFKNSRDTIASLFSGYGTTMSGVVLVFGATMFGPLQSTENVSSAIDTDNIKAYIVNHMPKLAWTPETVKRWRPYLEREAKKRNIDPRIPEIIMTLESGGDPHAESWVGAKGLMQIMPATGGEIARKLGYKKYNLNDPETNIEFGTFYIAERMYRFEDYAEDMPELVRLSAIGYNGGDGRAFNYIKGRSIPRESRIYSEYTHEMWGQREDRKSPAYERWYTEGNGRVLVEAAKKYTGPLPTNTP